MSMIQKYEKLRGSIKDGDIMIVHGTGIIASCIEWADSSWASHVLVIIEKHGALFCLDANANGVEADRLSYRIHSYNSGADFVIIRAKKSREYIDNAMIKLLHYSDDKRIRYDFKNGIKEFCNRAFGWKLKLNLNDSHKICSDEHRKYSEELDMMDFENIQLVYPQDYLRCKIDDNVIMIGSEK